MNEWKVIFATVLIFGAGVVTGGLLVNYVDHNHAHPARHASANSNNSTNSIASTNNLGKAGNAVRAHLPELLSKQFVDRLDKELQLTLDQRADIEKIIANSQDDLRRDFQDARLSARERIRKLLTPPQIKQFDAMLKSQHLPRKMEATNAAVTVTNATNSDK